jgi:hypothetical protein
MLAIRYPKIESTQDLLTAVQNAIKLEHATIPPYLTAYWTLAGASDGVGAAQTILGDIWLDEMHHMLAACNLLNALGGTPVINQPDFVPTYPGPLPMTIGTTDGHPFNVGLRRYSQGLVANTFMTIESPETPIPVPVGLIAEVIDDHYSTIGEFYAAIAKAITDGGAALFAHPSSPQVTHRQVTPITDVPSAIAALTLIRAQGEGANGTTEAAPNVFAHYYRFESLARGLTLSETADHQPFFDPNKPIVINDATDVTQMADDPGQLDLSQDGVAAAQATAFDQAYKQLLDTLHDVVNGQPAKLSGPGGAIGMMGTLTELAGELLGHQITAGRDAGKVAGPRFLTV